MALSFLGARPAQRAGWSLSPKCKMPPPPTRTTSTPGEIDKQWGEFRPHHHPARAIPTVVHVQDTREGGRLVRIILARSRRRSFVDGVVIVFLRYRLWNSIPVRYLGAETRRHRRGHSEIVPSHGIAAPPGQATGRSVDRGCRESQAIVLRRHGGKVLFAR